jgi:hypothetical protein
MASVWEWMASAWKAVVFNEKAPVSAATATFGIAEAVV